MEHFVAYHSVKKMGYKLKPSKELRFFSRKVGLLKKAIGNTVWVIQGIPNGKNTDFFLSSAYVADRVDVEDQSSNLYVISGKRVQEFGSTVPLNDLSWFPMLIKSQSNFSLGFNRINDEVVVQALSELKVDDDLPSYSDFHDIELFSPADYIDAFSRVEPTENQWKMLRVHMAAPNHTITARCMAHALGYSNWNSVNVHYGNFAGKLCNALSVSPSTNLSVLVNFFKDPNAEWSLKLRPSVVDALTELGIMRGSWLFQEELAFDEPLVEGSSFTVKVNAFERNPIARQKCIAYHGTRCAVCGFDFGIAYGDFADGYIHVHHLKPLASIGEAYVIDPIKDLRPVCPNCHAVIHLRQPPYSIEDIQTMLQKTPET